MTEAGTPTVPLYPQGIELGDEREVELRLMGKTDRDRIVQFARALPPEDLLFLRKDITNPAVVDQWVRDLDIGRVTTVLAEAKGELLGFGSLWLEETFWGRHMAEVRVQVRPDYRGVGLGFQLASDLLAIAKHLGIEKIIARVTQEQVRTRARLERLGFRPEAVLRGFAVDREGQHHDLVVMSTEAGRLTDAEERASWYRS